MLKTLFKPLNVALLAFVLFVGALAACNGNPNSQTNTQDSVNTETPANTETTADAPASVDTPNDSNLIVFEGEITSADAASRTLEVKEASDLLFLTDANTNYVDSSENPIDPDSFWSTLSQGQSIKLEGIMSADGANVTLVKIIVERN
jgi:hypothetical protein